MGFFLKHCFKKSTIKELQTSGIGGEGSSTMRNITEEFKACQPLSNSKLYGLTRKSIVNLMIRRMSCEQFDGGTSERPDIGCGRGSFELDDFWGHCD